MCIRDSVLGATLFGGDTGVGAQDTSGAASAWRPSPGEPVEVSVGSGPAPSTSTFDEALDLGLIGEISSYTTEYTTGTGTENRNHNIHLVADLLNRSIAPAGGTWSFNGTAGECNAERGFLGAGAIIDGEYDDAVGGGICQVAPPYSTRCTRRAFPCPRATTIRSTLGVTPPDATRRSVGPTSTLCGRTTPLPMF